MEVAFGILHSLGMLSETEVTVFISYSLDMVIVNLKSCL